MKKEEYLKRYNDLKKNSEKKSGKKITLILSTTQEDSDWLKEARKENAKN